MKRFLLTVFALMLFRAGAEPLRRLTVLPTGYESTTMALDPHRGLMYVITNVRNPETRKRYQAFITLYDVSTLKEARRIRWTHGDTPNNVAVDPRNGNLYIYQHSGKTIYVMAPFADRDLASIPVPDTVGSLTISRRLPRLYVSFPDSVGVVDTDSNTFLTSIPLPRPTASKIVDDPWVRTIFVTGTAQRLFALDPSSKEFRWNIPVGEPRWSPFSPTGKLAVDPSRHRLYLMQPWPHNRILAFDTRTLRRVAAWQSPNDLADISVDEGLGRIYVVTVSPSVIRILDSDTLRVHATMTKDIVHEPLTVQVDPRTHRIFVFSKTLGDYGVYEPVIIRRREPRRSVIPQPIARAR